MAPARSAAFLPDHAEHYPRLHAKGLQPHRGHAGRSGKPTKRKRPKLRGRSELYDFFGVNTDMDLAAGNTARTVVPVSLLSISSVPPS
jgi:hypothetical protein